jgi:hypothetical protein
MRRIKTKYIIEVLIHLVFWIGVYYTLVSLTSSNIMVQINHGGGKETDRMIMDSILANSRLTPVFLALLFYGNIFWILKKVIQYKRLAVGIAVAAGWFVLTFAANYLIVGPRINHDNPPGPLHFAVNIHDRVSKPGPDIPLQDSIHSIRSIKPDLRKIMPDPPFFLIANNWLHMQLTMLLVFLVVAGLSIAYFFLKEWARNELVRNQLAAYQLNTEIKFLKSQINPHFLFNTLNNLFSMAQEKGNDDLADGISKLSGMMRYMIYDSNAESVPLSKEITYLEECITLNKLRYADDEVLVTLDYPAQTGNASVAPMLFVPFVENAFKHGVAIGQTSAIAIDMALSNQRLIFACENTDYSATRKMTDEKSGIGLENVKRRLDLLYPGRHKLQISEEGGKFIVKLVIDLE